MRNETIAIAGNACSGQPRCSIIDFSIRRFLLSLGLLFPVREGPHATHSQCPHFPWAGERRTGGPEVKFFIARLSRSLARVPVVDSSLRCGGHKTTYWQCSARTDWHCPEWGEEIPGSGIIFSLVGCCRSGSENHYRLVGCE